MSDILLIRHGQSDYNAQRRWAGAADPPLTAEGESAARALATELHAARLEAVVTSDLARSLRTGEILAEALGLPAPEVEPRIRERDIGELSGLTTAEIEERFGEGTIDAYRAGRFLPPGGEPLDVFDARVVDGLHAVAAAHPGGRVLVVGHAGVIRAAERHLEADPAPLHNLGGRWLHLHEEHGLLAGEQWPS